MPPVAPIRHGDANHGADTHIVDIVAVVLAPGDADPPCSHKREQKRHGATEIPPTILRSEHVELASQEERQEPQARKRKRGVSRRERTPAVLEFKPGGRRAVVNG